MHYSRGWPRLPRGVIFAEKKKKDNNPKSFDDIYTNPLKELIYLAAYARELPIEAEKSEYQEQEIENRNTSRRRERQEQDLWRRDRQMYRKMQFFQRGLGFDSYRRRGGRHRDYDDYYEDEEYFYRGGGAQYPIYEERSSSQLDYAIKRQNTKSVYEVRKETINNFRSIKESFVRNKETVARCLAEMNNLGRGGAALASRDQWTFIQKIVEDKMRGHQYQFQRKLQSLATVEKPFLLSDSLTTSNPNKPNDNKNIKKISNLQAGDFLVLLKLAIYYLIAPEKDYFLRDILAFQKSFEEVMKKYSNEDYGLTSLIENLPYKQSSFYWEKIISCVRKIAGEDHYSGLQNRKIEFQTDYAGIITNETLRKLCNNCWLDNTITSAVIEYLKHIEGFNNYNEDNNYKALIFNHSESFSFMNSTNNLDEEVPKYEKLVFLINIDNSHWLTIAVYLRDSVIAVYDSLSYDTEKFISQITTRLKKLGKKFKQPNEYNLSPRQTNMSDCGVFAIINLIMAADKQQRQESGDMYDYRNNFKPAIISQIRHSLFLLLCYLGYCKKNIMVPRKDYFDIMFRSTIYQNIGSKLHKKKNKE